VDPFRNESQLGLFFCLLFDFIYDLSVFFFCAESDDRLLLPPPRFLYDLFFTPFLDPGRIIARGSIEFFPFSASAAFPPPPSVLLFLAL